MAEIKITGETAAKLEQLIVGLVQLVALKVERLTLEIEKLKQETDLIAALPELTNAAVQEAVAEAVKKVNAYTEVVIAREIRGLRQQSRPQHHSKPAEGRGRQDGGKGIKPGTEKSFNPIRGLEKVNDTPVTGEKIPATAS